MDKRFPRLLWAVLCIAGCGITACSSSPPKPAAVPARIVASTDLNPRPDGGSAQPVHVRVFQLKDDSAFKSADFWALVDKPQETLGAGLVQQLQFDIAPGAQQQLELSIDSNVHILAVVAEFADYLNTTWRAVSPTPVKSMLDIVKRKKRVVIDVGRDRIGIRVGT
jgi:type VI secretion system protein VasD